MTYAAPSPALPIRVVVMGVAGCGKSLVGQLLARNLGLPLVEGDGFHPAANIEKMRRGVALTDADRAGWLDTLARQLATYPQGVVLTCSALKRAYRERLRRDNANLLVVYLAVDEAEALERVRAREGHFYPPALVASQFAALERPTDERGVLTVDATLAAEYLAASAANWLKLQARQSAADSRIKIQ